jgi:hypothetical protein
MACMALHTLPWQTTNCADTFRSAPCCCSDTPGISVGLLKLTVRSICSYCAWLPTPTSVSVFPSAEALIVMPSEPAAVSSSAACASADSWIVALLRKLWNAMPSAGATHTAASFSTNLLQPAMPLSDGTCSQTRSESATQASDSYCPSGHEPTEQSPHPAAPVAAWNLPCGHTAYGVTPTPLAHGAATNVPAGHA